MKFYISKSEKASLYGKKTSLYGKKASLYGKKTSLYGRLYFDQFVRCLEEKKIAIKTAYMLENEQKSQFVRWCE